MPRVDRFVVHSEADRSHVRSQYLIPDAKISVVPHPVYDHFGGADRTGARREFGISDSDYALLAFGLIRSYKGIPDLIREFGELPDELSGKTKLVIVGEVWEGRDRIETALRQCRCRQRISFIDRYVPDSEVPKYFAAGDALVLPYTRASQSGVAHIAKAYGMPILATKVGGLAEALRDYPCGRLIEPGTPGILRAALISLVQERPPRGSVETVAESWEDVARGYRNVISIAA